MTFPDRRTLRLLALLTAAAMMPAAAAASPSSEAKRRQALALQSQLDRAGQRLSQATEAYDQSRLRLDRITGQLASAHRDLGRSQAHLDAARGKLAKTVRELYMHPAGWLEHIFDSADVGSLERGQVLASRVAGSTEDVILAVRRARADTVAKAARLKDRQDAAHAEARQLDASRAAAASDFRATQALLAKATGEYGAILESERQASLAAAGRIAALKLHNVKAPNPRALIAVDTARAQIGKPYQWGAAGPGAFDCSGLTMYSWAAAGVSLPHSSEAQYASLPHVPLADIAPGDLVFFYGGPSHVGIYEGSGLMVVAPHTGETVREQSIWSIGPMGAARP